MNTNFTSNEPLMIRDRLQEAHRKIIFIADNDFAQDANYKRAHQVLYARIRRVEKNREYDTPRSVREVIPNSNLAKYGQYHYNEARETSYTTCLESTPLHYPCLYKLDNIKEPWMLPEVEQIFIHTVFTSSYNFTLYEAELEQLEKVDLLEDAMPGLVPSCCTGDLHKVNLFLDHLFDHTPGKSYECINEEELISHVPYYFNVKEYDCILLSKRILSDLVREIWNKPNLESQDKLLKVYKSTLDNLFVEETNFKCVNSLKSLDMERSLQTLVESIAIINEKVPKTEVVEAVNKEQEVPPETPAPPTRRLYSDVVQGNKSPTKQQQQHVESKSPSPTKQNEEANSAHEPLKKLEASTCMSPQEPPLILDFVSNVRADDSSDLADDTFSDALNNTSNFPGQNLFLNDSTLYDNSNFRSTTSIQNLYNPMQCIPNTVYNTNYRLGYIWGYFTNQLSTSRPSVSGPSPTCQHQHSWLFPNLRSPSLCSYGNFVRQLLLPQMPSKHRWNTNPQYGRPTTPQNVYQPMAQNWGVYRSNSSTQQLSGYHQFFDPQKVKSNKTPNPTAPKFVRSQTPELKAKHCFGKKNPPKVLSKPTPDYKLMTRQDPSTSFRVFNSDSTIPVSCSASDELEKIALREYHSSNDMFFTEIERQAKEQYDEYLHCPVGISGTVNSLNSVSSQ